MVKLFYYLVWKKPIHSICEPHDICSIISIEGYFYLRHQILKRNLIVPERQPKESFNFLTKKWTTKSTQWGGSATPFPPEHFLRSVTEAYHAFTSCPFSLNPPGTSRQRKSETTPTPVTGSRSDTEKNVTMLPALLSRLPCCLFPVTYKHTKQQKQWSKMPGAKALQIMWSWAKQKLCREEKIICRLYLLVLSEVTVEAKGSQHKATKAAYRPKGYANYQGVKPVPLSSQSQNKSEMCVVIQSSNTTLLNCSCPVQKEQQKNYKTLQNELKFPLNYSYQWPVL